MVAPVPIPDARASGIGRESGSGRGKGRSEEVRGLAGWAGDAQYAGVIKVECSRDRIRGGSGLRAGLVPSLVLAMGLALLLAFGPGCGRNASESARWTVIAAGSMGLLLSSLTQWAAVST